MLIRLPDKREKNSNEESRKSGKEALEYNASCLPAFLPSSFIFIKKPDQHGTFHPPDKILRSTRFTTRRATQLLEKSVELSDPRDHRKPFSQDLKNPQPSN
jgi:hypothetical protein|tara:strand:- start:12498 stop:12800 length:303 start_codon:yes stop_codon:yes gene_type:complete